MRRVVALMTLVSLVVGGNAAGHMKRLRLLTPADVKALVLAYSADNGATRLPGFVITMDPAPYSSWPDYEDVVTMWDNKGPGSDISTSMAVDLRTGDIFSAVGCSGPESSPGLAKAQKRVRKRIGMTTRLYKRMRRPGWYCD